MVPPTLLAAAVAPSALAPDERDAPADGGFDAVGAILATAGSSPLVLGLVSGPEAGWGSLRGVGSIVAGVVLLAISALVANKTRNPLVPMRLFGNHSLVTAVLVILVFQSALGGSYYIGRAGATLFTGMLINGLGVIVLAVPMSTGAAFWSLVPGLVIWGIGGRVTFPVMFACAASGVAPQEAGAASALATTSQQIGGAAALAVLVAIATAGLAGDAGVAPAVADVAEGLRAAMRIGGTASVIGGLLAFTLKKPGAPAAEVPQEQAEELGDRSAGCRGPTPRNGSSHPADSAPA
ncbi:hypothetical protein QWJ26_35140 [Streptomyces sp. CSDS2]|nr:hypothetical protein [Streptomyces sp. CSDS2]MDN3264950.1 hypothetical protein [Streptomyces sp. CSDS2]